ncbi:MAG: PspC domain-containing protein [Chloroflexi bacterium]|nr:PspC domain-containing protein [Chloroflexota bacterium]MCI0576235.1 PspC domain-containing protein [Chloroflexota bacterium]MCI0645471.1 PspC domain-containing protein [Chloroflexota bacterium]MCI0730610.1 PspC domain-containing protein [Chloroflexota bacterium]
MQPRLVRSETDRMFAGVCGGLAAYLGIDSVLVRLAFIVLTFASGIGLILYLALMVLMPGEGGLDKPTGEVIEDNLGKLGNDISAGVQKVGQHPQGPTIAAGLLIALGLYFLMQNLGWFAWFDPGLCLPLILIGLGAYLLYRRSR